MTTINQIKDKNQGITIMNQINVRESRHQGGNKTNMTNMNQINGKESRDQSNKI